MITPVIPSAVRDPQSIMMKAECLAWMGIDRWVLRPQKTYALSVVINEPLVGECAQLLDAILKSMELRKEEVALVTDIKAIRSTLKIWILGEHEPISVSTQVIKTPALSTLLTSPKLKKEVFQSLFCRLN